MSYPTLLYVFEVSLLSRRTDVKHIGLKKMVLFYLIIKRLLVIAFPMKLLNNPRRASRAGFVPSVSAFSIKGL